MQSKKLQLFILPYAGGSVSSFKRLTDLIDDRIDVVTVEYAGRGTRVKDNFSSSIWELINDSIEFCRERRNPDIPYSIMGYSMGSILAYEIVIRKALEGKLSHLFISAEISPKDRFLELRKVENPTEEYILQRAKGLGGLDERMLNNKRFAEIYIKPMLSDYRLLFEYRFDDHNEKIYVDTTFFYCEKDTPFETVIKWNALIEGQFDFHEFGENHFFINQHYEEMARIINGSLCPKTEVLI